MSPINAIKSAKTLVATEPHKAKALLLYIRKHHPGYHDGWALLSETHKMQKEHVQQQSTLKQNEMIC